MKKYLVPPRRAGFPAAATAPALSPSPEKQGTTRHASKTLGHRHSSNLSEMATGGSTTTMPTKMKNHLKKNNKPTTAAAGTSTSTVAESAGVRPQRRMPKEKGGASSSDSRDDYDDESISSFGVEDTDVWYGAEGSVECVLGAI